MTTVTANKHNHNNSKIQLTVLHQDNAINFFDDKKKTKKKKMSSISTSFAYCT